MVEPIPFRGRLVWAKETLCYMGSRSPQIQEALLRVNVPAMCNVLSDKCFVHQLCLAPTVEECITTVSGGKTFQVNQDSCKGGCGGAHC